MKICSICAAALASILLAAASPANAESDAFADLVKLLHSEGVIDAQQARELLAEARDDDDRQGWLDRLSLWGDFRARYEGFFFDDSEIDDRHRARYRARLNARAEIASRAAVYLRLASGDEDPRSTNQTLGEGDDFDTDDVRFDLAYVTLSPFPDSELPGIDHGLLALDFGKVPNPFRWKALGPDLMLWDADITLEGGSLRLRGGSGPLVLFSHSGLYVIDEEGSASDSQLLATQLGGTSEVSDEISVGARGSVYHFFSLDSDFFDRAAAGGNIVDGLARRNKSIQVLEGSVFADFDCFELFPIHVFASYSHNLSARSSRLSSASRKDDAYSIGVAVGDKRTLVALGMAYYVIEANAFPSHFIDSDITDGKPNRRGFAWVLTRQLIPNIDFVYTAYLSDRIEGSPAFSDSVPGADRFRMRADLTFAF